MDEFNLHLTGDMHAISVAHNLVAAAIDARWYHEGRSPSEALHALGLKRLAIDPDRISWRRVVDVNDRASPRGHRSRRIRRRQTRESGYDISVASELMAILALADGADYPSALRNLRERVGRVVMGLSKDGAPITLDDLGVGGAVTVS